jgi:predicted NBD/HSP70 family sugar kinase
MRILVIDVGGSSVKFTVWGTREVLTIPSSPDRAAAQVVKQIRFLTDDWKYDAISIGFPGSIVGGKITDASCHLGEGWNGFDFEKRFRKPVRIMNDAAMQALGSYNGGRMLFLGLGTGLGSALILDDVIIPLALGELPHSKRWTLGEVLGKRGLGRIGRRAWEESVHAAVRGLAAAFRTDHVVLGGGNVACLRKLPAGARRGDNANAFIGGARLWGLAGAQAQPRKKHTWVIT